MATKKMINLLIQLRFANSYTRIPILLSYQPVARSKYFKEWLAALGDEWVSSDNISQFKNELSAALLAARERGLCYLLMNESEREALVCLPEKFTVYRGCYAINRDGLSWTLCKDVAQEFTTLNRYKREGDKPLLLERIVSKSEVIAFKTDRDEQEIILLPLVDIKQDIEMRLKELEIKPLIGGLIPESATAELLGYTLNAYRRIARTASPLPFIKRGNRRFYKINDVIAFLTVPAEQR